MRKFFYHEGPGYGILEIDARFLDEGLQHAAEHGHRRVVVRDLNDERQHLDVDFDPLASATFLESLDITSQFTTTPRELHQVYGLRNLKKLEIWQESLRIDPDRLPPLTSLTIRSKDPLPSFENLRSLEGLSIFDLKNRDLTFLRHNKQLRVLKIRGGDHLSSLTGIEGFPSLVRVELESLHKLKDARALNTLPNLRSLSVAYCTKLRLSCLAPNSTIEELHAEYPTSLRFIKHLHGLQCLMLGGVGDGDFTPVLEHPALNEIAIAHDYDQHSLTRKELEAVMEARRRGAPRALRWPRRRWKI